MVCVPDVDATSKGTYRPSMVAKVPVCVEFGRARGRAGAARGGFAQAFRGRGTESR